ncbi:DUF2750 domain-containing protein [Mucilaginibacter sp. BJC16-A38]|uniref:DUF2750 domain-containing protein n=1 Tax=Mucilaginibacter phenanthrenivorans TaxID=1234842 RepID=UPI00215735DF|nr:DUF2750 domain-containing protein [Mucilaginibacter phenanthrenivorans]MCR8558159.1 DUF2750 domain-containing protein [Mucilaginibacter phenanthrenivorans]
MLQDTTTIEYKYQFFIERVSASKIVWGLKNKQGWANSNSNEDEEIGIIPFWSDRAYAKACACNEWKGYLPTEIPLPQFLESWCVGMAEEDTLAGVNWDANMFGKESGALDLALDILNQLNTINSAITFLNYKSINEFITEISEPID